VAGRPYVAEHFALMHLLPFPHRRRVRIEMRVVIDELFVAVELINREPARAARKELDELAVDRCDHGSPAWRENVDGMMHMSDARVSANESSSSSKAISSSSSI